MTWRDFQIKPVLDCEREVKIETEKEVRTLVHEEEEGRIPAKKEEEDCTTDPVPQNMETK